MKLFFTSGNFFHPLIALRQAVQNCPFKIDFFPRFSSLCKIDAVSESMSIIG